MSEQSHPGYEAATDKPKPVPKQPKKFNDPTPRSEKPEAEYAAGLLARDIQDGGHPRLP